MFSDGHQHSQHTEYSHLTLCIREHGVDMYPVGDSALIERWLKRTVATLHADPSKIACAAGTCKGHHH